MTDEDRAGSPLSAGRPRGGCGFTLIEVMVVVALLSLIVIALMSVFNSTQSAFRASVTQSDILESGRATMDLIAQDLKTMSPSFGASNGAVNFYVAVINSPVPLVQPLTASGQSRTNILEKIFILSRNNQTWTAVGYVVDTSSSRAISPLYRFSTNMNVAAGSPGVLFTNFINASTVGMSHLLDGVLGFRVRAFDANGVWMNNAYTNAYNFQRFNSGSGSGFGESGFEMFSNTLPASVEIEMATLEDRPLQRAGTWPNNAAAQISYLAQQSGKVHIFRQRISMPNIDPSAYQQ
jgi:prepilin-type N-terminal cleavage/methylation domain-containing protein